MRGMEMLVEARERKKEGEEGEEGRERREGRGEKVGEKSFFPPKKCEIFVKF
jgi:hypothetical protein